MGTKLSVSEISQETGDSERQVHRYIRLTNLVPELLEFVDEGRIKMRPAVELSYLDEDCQRDIVDEIDMNEVTPSHDQAIRMRKFFDEGKLTTEVIQAIMSEEKPNQREKLVFRGDRVRKLIPKSIPLSETEDYVCKGFGVCQEKCVSFFVSFFHKCKSILLPIDLSSPLLIAKAEIALAIALFCFSSHLFRYLLIRS